MLAAAPDNRIYSHGGAELDTSDRPDPDADERELVRRARVHPEAFAPLYERYVDAIFGFCYRRTSDRELAADLTHQIFARVLTALPGFSDQAGAGSFRSWLFSIARNLVIDSHRTRKVTSSLDAVAGSTALHDRTPSPEDHAIANDLRHSLIAAMSRLTEGQRQVVELRLAGLTGPEIANALGLHLAAVKSTQFRAYARLREILGEQSSQEAHLD